jgi:hypothetical protein
MSETAKSDMHLPWCLNSPQYLPAFLLIADLIRHAPALAATFHMDIFMTGQIISQSDGITTISGMRPREEIFIAVTANWQL